MPYELKNPNSATKPEIISDEQYAAMQASGRLRNYEVTPVVKPAKPAELTAEKPAAKKAADDK